MVMAYLPAWSLLMDSLILKIGLLICFKMIAAYRKPVAVKEKA